MLIPKAILDLKIDFGNFTNLSPLLNIENTMKYNSKFYEGVLNEYFRI